MPGVNSIKLLTGESDRRTSYGIAHARGLQLTLAFCSFLFTGNSHPELAKKVAQR